jgi:hypothetical protein
MLLNAKVKSLGLEVFIPPQRQMLLPALFFAEMLDRLPFLP